MQINTAEWLLKLGLQQYESAFRKHEIDGEVLSTLTAEDLKEIGVVAIGHRRRLLNAIAALRDDLTSEVEKPDQMPDNSVADMANRADSERRQLTIVFCDLVGSTRLSERLDAEELTDFLASFRDTATNAIEHFGGFVAQFLGDGVLAYFGWPTAHENDPERAVRAALEIVDKVPRLDVHHQHTLSCRVGIATGPVVVGDFAGESFFETNQVVGRTPNLAARVQSVAEPDTVAIAHETRNIIGDRFNVTDIGTHDLKGIAEPVTIWRVDGLRDAVSDSVNGLALVNRHSEMNRLQKLWQQASKGRGRAIMISGEAGIGKSRLVDEMCRRVVEEGADILRFQCSPFHGNEALYPLLRQLRTALKTADGSLVNDGFGELEPMFADAGLDVAETSSLITPLLRVQENSKPATDGLDAQGRKEKTFQALLALFESRVRRSPVLVVFEDLHWADPTTLEYLDRFMSRINRQTVFALFTSRPDASPRWNEGPIKDKMDLGRLSADEVTELISLVSSNSGLPEDVKGLIADRSDGVPLFAEELSKTVVESGIAADDGLRDGAAVDERAIPMTLRDSLVARLDRIPEARKVAQTAAAIGREFSSDVLAEVLDEPPETLDAMLSVLIEANIILPEPDQPQSYTFKHALMRDAAYESMLRRIRSGVHERIAEVLERSFWRSAPSYVVAEHWALAGRHETATRCFTDAAARATSQYANAEAAAYYRKALYHLEQIDKDSLPTDEAFPKKVDLLESLSSILTLMHDVDGAVSALRSAIEQSADKGHRCARLWRRLGVALQQDRVGSLDALARAEKALGISDIKKQPAQLTEWIEIQLARLNVHYWSGYGEAMAALAADLAPHMKKATPEQRAEYFDQLVLRDLRTYRYRPRSTTVLNAENYVDAADETENLAIIASAQFILGFVHLHRVSLKKAEAAMEMGLESARRSGHRAIELRCLVYLATVCRRKDEIERATELSKESLEMATQEGMNEYIALATGNLAWSAWRRGRLDEARRHGRRALKDFKKSSIAYPFEWSALLPLIAASRLLSDLKALPSLCKRLIDPSQQQLPKLLNDKAKSVADSSTKRSVDDYRQIQQSLIHEARRSRFI